MLEIQNDLSSARSQFVGDSGSLSKIEYSLCRKLDRTVTAVGIVCYLGQNRLCGHVVIICSQAISPLQSTEEQEQTHTHLNIIYMCTSCTCL